MESVSALKKGISLMHQSDLELSKNIEEHTVQATQPKALWLKSTWITPFGEFTGDILHVSKLLRSSVLDLRPEVTEPSSFCSFRHTL